MTPFGPTTLSHSSYLIRVGVSALLLLASIGSVSAAPISVNELSPGYDKAARYQYSHNDVKAFVYQWFAGFDHQREAGYFLNRLAPEVRLQYPGAEPITSEQGFLAWYQGVVDNIPWNSHDLQRLEVTGEQPQGWQVSLRVLWQARDKQGEAITMVVDQEWRVTRVGDLLKIQSLDAALVGQDNEME